MFYLYMSNKINRLEKGLKKAFVEIEAAESSIINLWYVVDEFFVETIKLKISLSDCAG